MLSSFIKLACPVVLLLTLTIPIVAVSTSGSALENVWDIINSTGRVLPAPHIIPRSPIGHIKRRDVQLGTHSINLEPGVDFQDCVAAPKCAHSPSSSIVHGGPMPLCTSMTSRVT
ncbi:uncharacterized protein RSE6_06768 [Rhynchosporium secalis]|uniref:Uncharacterized protein n=1 Tax=Rhynchosporium secalis TaxID=38038 RepID=A0A1E1MC69_RHYSE|nr:uncharacterized protein RSE6_06768 [Rhynchosporium secalis]